MAETSTNLGRVSVVPKGEYDPTVQYQRLDLLQYNGAGYLALRTVQGVTPVNGEDYMLLAERGADGESGTVGPQGPAGPGVPTGGTAGQVLAKNTAANYDTHWIDPPEGDIDLSAYAPKADPVFTGSISMGRKAGTTVGLSSFAIGANVAASGSYSHAEGSSTTASGSFSHAEGELTIASGSYSHAEGLSTTASGKYSHAEGAVSNATGYCSHAIGSDTTASGHYSYAGGSGSVAKKDDSFATGYYTIAGAQYQMAIGASNVESTAETDKFIIGKSNLVGARANCFRVTHTGTYASGSYNASGADYAEMFEWADGNPDGEDRAGRFVTLDGAKIRLATPQDDYIIGVVSGNPSVVGDVHDDQWQGMYLYDVFGRPLWEDVDVPDEIGPDGTVMIPAHTEHRQRLNPDYDNTQPYQPRSQRPEWDAVGMLGKLVAVDDGSCTVNGWCTVGEGGIAVRTESRTRYRVMERIDESHIRILIL